jgi:hypothetical protein
MSAVVPESCMLALESGQDDLQSIAEYADAFAEGNCYPNFDNCSPVQCVEHDEELWSPENFFATIPESVSMPSTFSSTPKDAKVAGDRCKFKKKVVRAEVGPNLMKSQFIWDCMYRKCRHKCFKRMDKIALGDGIKALRKRVKSAEHKAQFLLDYMRANETKHSKKKKRQVKYMAPDMGKPICQCCFAAAAGFVQVDGKLSITFKRVLAAYNRGDLKIDFRKGRRAKRNIEFAMEPRIVAWIDRWLPGNHGTSPMNPDELHLNAKSKQAVWVLCCEDFVKEAFLPPDATEAEKNRCRPSKTYFLAVMKDKYHCVIHKHKRFSQCALCSMFKELTKQCTVINVHLELINVAERR